MTFLFALLLDHAQALRPDLALSRYVGPYRRLTQTRLPSDRADGSSRWRVEGIRDGRRFVAEVLCVEMSIASNKYAYYKQTFCQPVSFDLL